MTLSVFTFLRRKRDVARLASYAAGRKGKGRSGMASTLHYGTSPSSPSSGLAGLRFFRKRPGIGKSKLSDVEMHDVQHAGADSPLPKGAKTPDQWSIRSQLMGKPKNPSKEDDIDVSIRDA